MHRKYTGLKSITEATDCVFVREGVLVEERSVPVEAVLKRAVDGTEVNMQA